MKDRLSLRFYMIAGQMILVILMLSITLFIWYNREERRDVELFKDYLENQAQLLAADFKPAEASPTLPPRWSSHEFDVIYIPVNGSQVELTPGFPADYKASDVQMISAEALQGHTASSTAAGRDGKDQYLFAAAPVWDSAGAISGTICLVEPMESFESTLLQSRNDLLVLFTGVGLASLMLGLAVAAFIVNPLKVAGEAAARVAGGDYDLSIPQNGPRETRALAKSLNRMAGELKKEQKNRQMILSNVTHELARPIGALRLGVDSLQGGGLKDPALAEDLLSEMNYTLNHMEALVDDLSLAARPLAVPLSVERRCFPVEPLLYGLRSRFWPRAESRQIELQISIPNPLPPILADEVRVNQMISNLVDNALKYTPTGSRVLILAEQVEKMIKISVLDSGPGVPQVDLERISEPFFQGRNVKGINQGMGLGLSIVRQLAEAHKGSMQVFNRPEGGFGVELCFETCPLTQE